MKNAPNLFELLAITEALRGPETWKMDLARQISFLSVVSRVDTYVGGFTNFNMPEHIRAYIRPDQTGYPPTVDLNHPELIYGGAAIVWTAIGKIDRLEYYSIGNEKWPMYGDNSVELFQFLRE